MWGGGEAKLLDSGFRVDKIVFNGVGKAIGRLNQIDKDIFCLT